MNCLELLNVTVWVLSLRTYSSAFKESWMLIQSPHSNTFSLNNGLYGFKEILAGSIQNRLNHFSNGQNFLTNSKLCNLAKPVRLMVRHPQLQLKTSGVCSTVSLSVFASSQPLSLSLSLSYVMSARVGVCCGL